MEIPTVGFDVGNSSVKAGRFQDGCIQEIGRAETRSAAAIHQLVESVYAQDPFPEAAIATVNEPASAWLEQALQESGVRIRAVCRSNGDIFHTGLIRSDLDTPETTGVDRVLACFAARKRRPTHDVIVITCGTAITVNLFTRDNVFRGGAILPGVELMAQSLHKGTTALPSVECPSAMKTGTSRSSPELPGRSTTSAIQAGIYFAAAGAIDRITDELMRSVADPQRYITGGDAALLLPALRTRPSYAESLVLEGLLEYVRENPS